jgi:hypothetical protein
LDRLHFCILALKELRQFVCLFRDHQDIWERGSMKFVLCNLTRYYIRHLYEEYRRYFWMIVRTWFQLENIKASALYLFFVKIKFFSRSTYFLHELLQNMSNSARKKKILGIPPLFFVTIEFRMFMCAIGGYLGWVFRNLNHILWVIEKSLQKKHQIV